MDDDIIRSPDTGRKHRVPPGQRTTEDLPVLHHGPVPDIRIEEWTFRMFGLVERERSLTGPEFLSLPMARVLSDIHCVTGWSRLENLWEGVSSSTVIDLARPLHGAAFVIVHAFGGFTANLPLEDFSERDVIFAVRHNGAQLEPEHGYPVRLVVPRLYFWKSAKWVTGVEFSENDSPGFWESRGYHMHGDPWKEERYGR